MSSKLSPRLATFQTLLARGQEITSETLEQTYFAARASFEEMVHAAPVVTSWILNISDQFLQGDVQGALRNWNRMGTERDFGLNIGFLVTVTDKHPERDAAFFRDLFDLPPSWDALFDTVRDNAHIIQRLISLENAVEVGRDKRWLALSATHARSPDPDYPYPMVRFNFHTPYGEFHEFVEDVDDLIDNIHVMLEASASSLRQWSEHDPGDLADYLADRLADIQELAKAMESMLRARDEGVSED